MTGRVWVLDASIVVRWYVPEPGRAAALAILDDELQCIAPTLLVTEVASALRRKIVAGDVDPPEAHEALASLIRAVRQGSIQLTGDDRLIEAALRLAQEAGHKVPDCVYLALAQVRCAGLVAADRKLAQRADALGVPCRFIATED